MTRYLYIMTEGLSPTVIDSQVLDTLVVARRKGIQFDLLALVSPRDWLANRHVYEERRIAAEARLGGKITLRAVPKLGWKGVRKVLSAWIALRYVGKEPLVLHARHARAGDVALGVKGFRSNTRVIVDIRGDVGAESRMQAASGDPRAEEEAVVQESLVRTCVQRADRTFAVSHALAEFLRGSTEVGEESLRVFPCLADESRFSWDPEVRNKLRKREGLDGKFVVVFPGSTGRWHHLPATLAFLKKWMEEDSRLYFVALTPGVEAMEDACADVLEPGRFRVFQATHDEVAEWLNAADLGILLRALDPVNRVASPTKFAEYALTGLPVAISESIGDYSEMVAQENVGFFVDDEDLNGSVARATAFVEDWTESDRTRWSQRGAELLSKGARLEDWALEYQRLSEGN